MANYLNSDIIKESTFRILVKAAILAFLGAILIFSASVAVRAVTSILIILIFLDTIKKGDFFSVLMQLFICNYFIFFPEIAGMYNCLFIASLIIFSIFGPKFKIKLKTSFTTSVKWSLSGLFVFQLLSVLVGNDFPISKQVIGLFTFVVIGFVFYFSSSIPISNKDYLTFINLVCILCIYMFLVSLNQKKMLITSVAYNNPFFPRFDVDSVSELDLSRSSGVFQNTEAYAEYSLSTIALLLPGIIHGSFRRVSKNMHFLTLFTVFIALLSIILSVTRSSLFLFPILMCVVIYNLKKFEVKTLFSIAIISSSFFIVNSIFHIVDFDAYNKRKASTDDSMNVSNLSISKILTGEDINRGWVFKVGMENIVNNGGFIGGGYFTSRQEYHEVHFQKNKFEDTADYHNMYLSIIVMWGFIGALLFLAIILSIYIRGVKTYRSVRQNYNFSSDLLLGFNIMIPFFLINEYKIQFDRNVNYFILMFILMGMYSSLIKQLSNGKKNNNYILNPAK